MFQQYTFQTPITIVTDASTQKNKQSGFSWVILHLDKSLWKGVGLFPGPAKDMYLGRVEAFGLLAALIFTHYYISCYKLQQFSDSLIQCFFDNLGVITNMSNPQNKTVKCPNNATNDDHNVYLAILQATRQCAPLQVSFPMYLAIKTRTQSKN